MAKSISSHGTLITKCWLWLSPKLHALILFLSLSLICTSPWILIGRKLRSNATFWDLFHVYGGILTAVLAILFSFHVCRNGVWRQFFPWLVGDLVQVKQDLLGLTKAKMPVSGSKGLISLLEGLGIILLLLVAITGVIWFFASSDTALQWRSWHKLFAQGFIGFIVLHALLALSHLRDFFD